MNLTTEQIERFRQEGYMSIEQWLDADAIDTITSYYDRFLNREIDCGGDDRLLGGITRQVMHPHKHHPYFRDNPALNAGREIARRILDRDVELHYSMLISKPPGNTNETPWHQDYAYNEMPITPVGTPIPNSTLQFWVALDDVDESNGCMHFIPRTHRGTLLEHYVASGDPASENRLLAAKPPIDTSRAVACPLPRGGCTVHYDGTMHYTPGNRTRDRNRRAYIFNLIAR